jgi:hypothetical protein
MTYTPEQQRRNARIAYALVVPFAILCVGIALWIAGNALDHMTDPCRTEGMRAVTPACISR